MRTIPAAITTAIQTGQIKPFICIFLDIDSGYYYTSCDVPIYISGDKYWPRDFKLGEVSYSLGSIVDNANLSIDNNDDEMSASFIDGTPEGSDITIYAVLLDSTNQIIGSAVTIFKGELDEWNLHEGTLDITISNQLSQWNQTSLSQHTSSCRWKVFRGTECTFTTVGTAWSVGHGTYTVDYPVDNESEVYICILEHTASADKEPGAGANWTTYWKIACDRSYATCTILDNLANYGGFKWLPWILNAQFAWGDESVRVGFKGWRIETAQGFRRFG